VTDAQMFSSDEAQVAAFSGAGVRGCGASRATHHAGRKMDRSHSLVLSSMVYIMQRFMDTAGRGQQPEGY